MRKVRSKNLQTYHRYKKIEKQLKKQQKEQAENYLSQIRSVISKSFVLQFSVNDFSEPCSFVVDRYPEVRDQLYRIPIYEVPEQYMEKFQLGGCRGCYLPGLRAILLNKRQKKITDKKYKNKIEKAMAEYSIVVENDDVIVHELFHAASHALNRRTRKFSHLEEEFVYKNTIDWFLSKGMNEEEIVNKNFLPFVMQDVVKSDRLEIVSQIAKNKNIPLTQANIEDQEFVLDFMNEHAEVFVQEVVKRARKLGMKMIEQNAQNISSVVGVLDFS